MGAMHIELLDKSYLKVGQAVILIWYSTRTFQWEEKMMLVERQYEDKDTFVLYEPNQSTYQLFENTLHLIKRDIDGEIVIKRYRANYN